MAEVSHKITLLQINKKLIFVLIVIPAEENFQLSLILFNGLCATIVGPTIIYKLFN